MAGLKKKKKESTGSPNIVLVIFLVFFVLGTITLGVLLYYAMEEKTDARKKMADAKKDADIKKLESEYFSMLYFDLLDAVDDRPEGKLGKEIAEERAKGRERMVLDREAFLTDGFGKFREMPFKDSAKSVMDYLRTAERLDKNGKDYKLNYEKKVELLQEAFKRREGELAVNAAKNIRMENLSNNYQQIQNNFRKEVIGKLGTNTKEILDAINNKKNELMGKLEADKTKFDEDINKLRELYTTKQTNEELLDQIKKLGKKITELEAGAAAGVGAPGVARPASGDTQPLIIDSTMGKLLWDTPVARVVSVDLDLRQVVIDKGFAHDVVPELTFTIFGADSSGRRADKKMKGSIEVIKVLDTTSSLCRITSLYDPSGREINLADQGNGQILREADNAMRKGDLVYNMFWGTRVAIAGYVNITGDRTDSPAEQARQMEDLHYLLKRNGMQVDAYVDLVDGTIRGNLSPQTRYLILGTDLKEPKAAKAGEEEKDKDKDKDKDKEPMAKDKEPMAKGELAHGERNIAINKASQTLRRDAVERGMLLISAENFITIIGYRKARSATDPEVRTFRPGLPYIGPVLPADRPKEEKKGPEMEKKEMEKKDPGM